MSAPERIWVENHGASSMWDGDGEVLVSGPPPKTQCDVAEYIRSDLLTTAQAEIVRLTAELEDWKAAATRHHPNPADYRYWEGRYRDEKARAEKAEAERDAGIALLAAWRAPDVEDLIAALKYMLQWFPVSEEDDFDEGPDPVDVAKRALAAFEV